MVTFLIDLGAHMNILSNMDILVLVKWPRTHKHKLILYWLCVSHILRSLSNLSWTYVFGVTIIGATPNYIPYKYKFSIKISNWISHVYLFFNTWFHLFSFDLTNDESNRHGVIGTIGKPSMSRRTPTLVPWSFVLNIKHYYVALELPKPIFTA